MPRGQKSKLRAREKRQQKRDQTQGLGGPQATAEKEEECLSSSRPSSCSSLVSGGGPPSSPAACIPQESQGAPPSSSPDAGVADARAGAPPSSSPDAGVAEARAGAPPSSSPDAGVAEARAGAPPSSPPDAGVADARAGAPPSSSPDAGVAEARADEGAKSQDQETPSTSQASSSTASSETDPLTRKAGMLVVFLLDKYKTKERIMKADMLKVVSRKYKEHFPEILKRTRDRLELVYGLELKGVKPREHSYTLVSKLGLSSEGCLSGNGGLPKSGFVMSLLGIIFLKGNRATEEEIWEFLNALGIYAGRRHLIFGEPWQFITKLVQEKYLEYRQVPNSDPACYEFLWGPRACAETSKLKVLEFLAKIKNTVPSSFPSLYDEALRDERERAALKAAARARTIAQARARLRAMSLRPSPI